MSHSTFSIHRVLLLSLTVAFLAVPLNAGRAESFTKGEDVEPFSTLKTGDYVWKPEISPSGPVVIIVSIPEQRLYVYRNGVRIGRSTASTGRTGHDTPTGVFTVLEKQKEHYSSIYKGASMPYMQRLTWGGIALHAGQLPGYAASHGCVRLPYDFAQKLFTVTGKGTTVIVTDGKPTPAISGKPGYLLTGTSGQGGGNTGPGDFQWNPEKSPTGPVSIVFSAKSSRAFVFRGGVEIGRAVVRGGENLDIGTHAYTALDSFGLDGRRNWSAIDTSTESAPDPREVAKRLSIPPAFLTQVRTVIQPGTTLVISDAPVDRSQPIDTNINILSTEKKKSR